MLLIQRLILLSFLWLLSIAKSQMHNASNARKDFVTHADRNRTAATVLEYMNLEANPCEDFFEFACGKWVENRSLEGEGDMVTPQTELEMGILKDLEAILSDIQGKKQSAEQKVLHFYHACSTALSNSPLQEVTMKILRDQYGHMVNYDWLDTLARLRATFGFNVLIGFEIDTNMDTFSGNSIYIGEPKTTIIPPEYCNAATIETMDIHDQIFQKLIEEISRNMQKWTKMRENEANQFGKNIIDFEFELCKKMHMEEISLEEENAEEENEIQSSTSRRVPIGQKRLHGRSKNGVYLNDLSNFDIDIKRYVTKIINYQHNEQIFLRSKEYFKNLAKQIRTIHTDILANYILYRVYSEFNFPISDDIPVHRNHCARWVKKLFPKIAGELYQRRFQSVDYVNELGTFFGDVKTAFDASLNADWITENTKRAARQKLSEFQAKFPIYNNLGLNDLAFYPQHFWEKLLLVVKYNAKKDLARLTNANPDERSNTIEAYDIDARLMPLDSDILVGLALLREPLYENYYPNGMKYALLGHRLARELVLAFDEEGWRPTPQSQRQWDALTEEGFHNQSDCFREQHSNYLYNNPEEFRNSTKLREIIADSSGLNLAFNAYLGWLENMDPRDRRLHYKETLPGVNFTNTQLFFIHFAQTRCAAKVGDSPPPDFLPLKKHTPQRYAVNGPLSNCEEFAREFGCTPGDEMHPVDKCVIY